MTAALVLSQGASFATAAAGRHEGPRGVLDYALVAIAILTVVVVTVLCVKYFVRPGEKEPDHIKRRVLADDPDALRTATPPAGTGRPASPAG